MKATIIAVGTELLMGKTVNTNSTYLSKELNDLGIDVLYHKVVGDNPKRLEELLLQSMKETDLIITTGGLGPTQDDLTKEVIGKAFGKTLHMNERVLQDLKAFFKKIDREMTDNNVRQAYFPESARVIPNDKGTAPGFILENENNICISLPGPPREMKAMYQAEIKNILSSYSQDTIVSQYVNLFGIGESSAEDMVKDLISEQSDPSIAIYAGNGVISFRLTTKAKSEEEGYEIIKPIKDEMAKRFGQLVFSYDSTDFVKVFVENLIKKNLTISTAESCTGGLIAKMITDVSGASSIFERGYITYSNTAKADELNVSEETLKKYGAVSEETALEMVEGLYNKTKSNICISVTGIAGPNGGSKEKPVGLVYVGYAVDGDFKVKKLNLTGDRERIRRLTAFSSLDLIRKRM
jgi:nicotinamide-nucleotide amidase